MQSRASLKSDFLHPWLRVGKHKGYALVEFEDAEDTEHAIFNMSDSLFFGKVIKVTYSKAKSRHPKGQAVWKDEEWLKQATENKELYAHELDSKAGVLNI